MLKRRLPMPPERHLPWPLKPLESAETSLDYDAHGRMVLRIRHDLIKGVTPRMIAWWFANIAGEIEIAGKVYPRYFAWHPRDHIHWELAWPGRKGGASAGGGFRIVEAFGRNPGFYIDVTETLLRLDEHGITLAGSRLGQQVSELRHDFAEQEGGTLYLSALTVGTSLPVLGARLNPLLHRLVFSEEMGRAWLRHNIEEVGLLEHILPRICPPEIAG